MAQYARIRVIALLLIPPALGFTIGVSRTLARLATPAQLLPQGPPAWVPFSADVTVAKPNQTVVGRYYRRSDGSYRLDTGSSPDDIQVTYIYNASEAQVYAKKPVSGWTVHILPDMVPGRFDPPTTMANRIDISHYPYRLAIRRGESGSLTATEGFPAVQTLTPEGAVKLSIPELNFFEVEVRLPTGRHEAYTNIEIGEQPVSLFHPPGRIRVVRRATPGEHPM
jgi:hypothetical protein